MRSRLHLFAALLSATLLGAAAQGASAQDARKDAEEAALHFQRAVEALKAQDRAAALREFRKAEDLAPAASTLCNIAVLEVARARPLDATRDLLAYRERAGSTLTEERARVLSETLAALERKLAKVHVEISPKEANVRIDDREVSGTVFLASGEHV